MNRTVRGQFFPNFLKAFFFKIGSMPIDSEIHLLERAGLAADSVGDQEIKSRSSVVNDITDDSAPPDWNRLTRIKDDMLRAVRISMNPESIRLSIDESANLAIKLCEVFLCPFYLGARSEPWLKIVGADMIRCHGGFRLV